MTAPTQNTATPDLVALDELQRRVLWLATSVVHHANKVRTTPSGIKVGGHQASSASMVSLMTALWFDSLTSDDRVSVKPHASPVLHAIHHLLGELDASWLETLRRKGGLQSYPSRTKDPDRHLIDYSTGSVGIGATAPVWGAVARRYLAAHLGSPEGGRQISLLGDAELDEGAVWETVADPMVAGLGEVLWVVDLNRQSLDRVVPDIAATRLQGMFAAAGWQVLTLKYGAFLDELFARPFGASLRQRIDGMGNEEFQRLLRLDPAGLRERLPGEGTTAAPVRRLLADLDDEQVMKALRDLGGHDLGKLCQAYRTVSTQVPTVLFAYTVKGWSLPTQGHPSNHSALLETDQWRTLGHRLGADPDQPWAPLPDGPGARLAAATSSRLKRPEVRPVPPPAVPAELGRTHTGTVSTQAALGRFFLDLLRQAPEAAARVVTMSPDVASSTNLGGWINKVGVFNPVERQDWFADDTDRLVAWTESAAGQHVELGIAEVNLVGLMGELGATWQTTGEPLLPVGTIYDPFVSRALEPWSYGVYAGGQSILVGTPSGITLAPEGGAHQSIGTPSIGLEQPGVCAWEPAFAQDLEWAFCDALGRLGRPDGEGAYFRLSTRPVDQTLAQVPSDPGGRESRRRQVLAGAYRLRGVDSPDVQLVAVGAVVTEALAAATTLSEEYGVEAEVVVVTSADRVFRAWRARGPRGPHDDVLAEVLTPGAPLVTVQDGHPHTLAFLAAVTGGPVRTLGVDSFGQSGDLAELYEAYGIDTDAVVAAALGLVEG